MKKRLLIIAVVVAGTATLGAFALSRPVWPWSKSAAPNAAEHKGSQEEARTKVVLTPEKFETVKLSYAEVARRSLQSVRTVQGKIDYRSVKCVEIKAPVDLVVQKVLVKPGAPVEPGTKLAILTSPDVGTARAEVEKSESDLKIANQAFEWSDEITRNLNELLLLLKDKPSFEIVEQTFDTKLLGNHRQDILPAYSRFIAAEKLRIGADKLFQSGGISEQKRVQAVSASEIAWEQYRSVCEQSRFDARQAREKARQNQMYARQLRDVRRRELKTLLGQFSELLPSSDSNTEQDPESGAELTRFYLISPLSGTVERRSASDSQRVDAGTSLFVVANTDTLEVRADVREGDWQQVSLSEGQMLKVVVTAVGEEREFDAKVDYVGRAVDAQTRAVPLIALLDNAKHEFKPGMFARIKIPSGTTGEELVVPAAAIRTHDSQDFVFAVDADVPRTFHRVDVVVGKRTSEWVTIATGLSKGQRIVVEGAFLLKNELLLEQEED
jgi:cobalt-zinc-cadmium efflux system membrane fusion protein